MEFEETAWDVEGWTFDNVSNPASKQQKKKTKKRKQSEPASAKQDPKKEPPLKKQKLTHQEIPQNTDSLEEESKVMTKSMKRRLRRKRNEEKRLSGSQVDQKTKGKKNESDDKTKSEVTNDTKKEVPQVKDTNVAKEDKTVQRKAVVNDSLQARKEKLKSGQFRWLNEQLYTSNSENAMELFKNEPELFTVVRIIKIFCHELQPIFYYLIVS